MNRDQEQKWQRATRDMFNAIMDLVQGGDEETYSLALDEIIEHATQLKRLPVPTECVKHEFKTQNQLPMLEKVAYIALQTERRMRYL